MTDSRTAKGNVGPWEIVRRDPPHPDMRLKRTYWEVGNSETRRGIALVFGGEEGDERYARLIRAAPDLLKALQGVVKVADRATDEFDAARAAIAKATGSTV